MLISLSFTLDFVEQELISDVSDHGRRVAYIAARIGRRLNLNDRDLFDLISYALLHDNGITAARMFGPRSLLEIEQIRQHCIQGEKNVRFFPFFHPVPNVILYHNEYCDGSGFFGRKGNEIPLYSRVIALSDFTAIQYVSGKSPEEILDTVKRESRKFDPGLTDLFFELGANVEFWLSMSSIFVGEALSLLIPQVKREFSYCDIRKVSQIFSCIIDEKSPFTGAHSRGISEKTGILCRHYGYDEQTYWKMRIAADLHDLGKIMVPNSILDKPGSLTPAEISVVQSHPFYTRKALEVISGFEDITNWAANHHEKLNGTGYPYGFTRERLDFNSRMLACIDIYQALTEDRPYRVGMSHGQAVGIMRNMARMDLIEPSIVEDISRTFRDEGGKQPAELKCAT